MTRDDDLLVRAFRREPTPRPPVWLMRQAGRYLPEYMEVRRKAGGFLEMAQDPELAAEITLQPIRRFGMDGAVLFSDILMPLQAMGMPLQFVQGKGPVLDKPLRSIDDINALAPLEPEDDLAYVGESIRRVRAELPEGCTMLGFCGAPYTLASYAVEGGTSRSHAITRQMMHQDPGAFDALMGRLAGAVGAHLAYQVEQGAQAVVLFDSWAGALSRDDWMRHCRDFSAAALEPVLGKVPVMAFALGGQHLYDDLVGLGVDALVVDWRMPLGEAFERYGDRVALQGNFDPAWLLGTPDEVARRARAMVDEVGGRPGWVMALGHGVMKETDPEAVAAFVEVAKNATVGASA